MTERKRIPRYTLMEVAARDGMICSYCKCVLTAKQLTIDHKIPVCEGGTNDANNLCISCRKCNNRKGASTNFGVGFGVFQKIWNVSNLCCANKLVLLAIAFSSNSKGRKCSVYELSRVCGMSERTVQRVITKLATSGYVNVLRKAGDKNEYIVNL